MGPGDGRSDRRDRGRDQVRGPRRGRDRQRVRDLSPDPLRTFHRERRERPALFGAPAGGGPARAVLAQTAAGLRSLRRRDARGLPIQPSGRQPAGLLGPIRPDHLPALDGRRGLGRQTPPRAGRRRGGLGPVDLLHGSVLQLVVHRLRPGPVASWASSRAARRPWRRTVSGVLAAWATTARVPTMTVAIRARVTAV